MAVAGIPFEATLVFGLIGVALVLFVSEVIPNDVTAIGVIVALAALGPTIGLTPRDAIAGFANPATITIVAMYMLSAGIQNTGIVQRLGVSLAGFVRGDEGRALLATVGTTGPIAGFVNNTPVVAVFIPMITDLAEQSDVSPSKLLLPLSYAAILGGTLTLVGTSTNILASDFTRQLIPGRNGIGMFEFTPLGVLILVVGLAYLLTIGRRLTPARIPVDADLVSAFDLEEHLSQVRVPAGSSLLDERVADVDAREDVPVDVLQLRRNGEAYAVPDTDQRIAAGDVLVVNGPRTDVTRFRDAFDLRRLVREDVSDGTFDDSPTGNTLATAVVPDDSTYVGETLAEARLEEFHRTTVLAVRRGRELIRGDLDSVTVSPGDLLLVRLSPTAIEYFAESGDLVVTEESASGRIDEVEPQAAAPLSPKTPLAVAIMASVIGAAALNLLPIVIAALGGVFAMIVTGCLSPSDAYDAVSWNIVFLLAGVIPLGFAMEATGGATVLADALVATEAFLPLVLVMLLFYLFTGLLANVITPVATIVLMIPVAVDAAGQMGADPFSFLLAVMFASATSFMTPVGYQTNLMVYGPGGYRFSDFLKVGGPLQLLLAVVTTVGIATMWGLT
ncbi:Arsenite transport protein [Halorhabdus tiamatea SARL4B]|uniref:Arsenite transport protein n=1 Tax=Halorhabdus tiamatea SARL4B TaxID=1033806 RepID=F7PHB1_9EURY|nr:SLC13 family permease [Halorhabdus tiamatea]ERJ05553.1 Arsenite transport protein [Halorhabdus tiamatea SARL4B]CCQ32529.1 sulfate permease, Trk-type [Halorhabdus tiamatea SARL4B]